MIGAAVVFSIRSTARAEALAAQRLSARLLNRSRGHKGKGDAEADVVVKRSHAEGEATYALTLGLSTFSTTAPIAVGSIASSGRPGSSGDAVVSCSISSI